MGIFSSSGCAGHDYGDGKPQGKEYKIKKSGRHYKLYKKYKHKCTHEGCEEEKTEWKKEHAIDEYNFRHLLDEIDDHGSEECLNRIKNPVEDAEKETARRICNMPHIWSTAIQSVEDYRDKIKEHYLDDADFNTG